MKRHRLNRLWTRNIKSNYLLTHKKINYHLINYHYHHLTSIYYSELITSIIINVAHSGRLVLENINSFLSHKKRKKKKKERKWLRKLFMFSACAPSTLRSCLVFKGLCGWPHMTSTATPDPQKLNLGVGQWCKQDPVPVVHTVGRYTIQVVI